MNEQRIKVTVSYPRKEYSEAFKTSVVREFESGKLNKEQLRAKYGIDGNSRVLDWCRKYGSLCYPEKGTITGRPMKDPQKRRIQELEKQLAGERLKVVAFKKLIEIAEREEGISILKKGEAKRSGN